MSLFLSLHFQSPGPYRDATQVRWKVFEKDKRGVLQEGLLIHHPKATYGTFDELQRLPQVTEKDVQAEKITNTDCKTPEHIRHIVWVLIQAWKKKDPNLRIGVSGGWSTWSHFLHRLVHDDFARRGTEDLSNVLDIDTLRLMRLDAFSWLLDPIKAI